MTAVYYKTWISFRAEYVGDRLSSVSEPLSEGDKIVGVLSYSKETDHALVLVERGIA